MGGAAEDPLLHPGPSVKEIEAQLEKILTSATFVNSDRMSRFLRFVVEQTARGQGGQMKEYIIGVEVFDRGESFNPQIDSIVRGGARRLRSMLLDYYGGEGQHDAVQIELPKGSYVPVFKLVQTGAAVLAVPKQAPSRWWWLRGKWLGWGVLIASVAGIISFFEIERRSKKSYMRELSSVAVLPFRDISPQQDKEFLCEGITEELIHVLASVPGLHVTARESVLHRTGPEFDSQTLGRQLNAQAVVHGTLQAVGPRLRVWVRLIETANGMQLFSESYDGDLRDIFKIQDEIARSVIRALRSRVAVHTTPLVRYTKDFEAHNAYLLGRHLLRRATREDTEKAREYLEQATSMDPGYAAAYAGLAHVFNFLSADPVGRLEFSAKANWAARKALELDPSLADAHVNLAWELANSWDWLAAEREFRRALDLDPDSGEAHGAYAVEYLVPIGRMTEALGESQQAIMLDPLSPTQHRNRGWVLYYARDYDAAIKSLQTAREIDSRMFVSLHLGKVMLQQGRFEEAARECQWPVRPDPVCVAMAYAGAGRAIESRAIMLKVQTDQQLRHRRGDRIAEYYAFTNQKNEAFRWLDEAIRTRSPILPKSLRSDPLYDSLRSDPRFANLVRRVGLTFP